MFEIGTRHLTSVPPSVFFHSSFSSHIRTPSALGTNVTFNFFSSSSRAVELRDQLITKEVTTPWQLATSTHKVVAKKKHKVARQ